MSIFTKHPNSVGENYFQHLFKALGYFFYLLFTSFFIFIHAFLPFLFKTKASDRINKLDSILQSRKQRKKTKKKSHKYDRTKRNESIILNDKYHHIDNDSNTCSVDSNTCSVDSNTCSVDSNTCSIDKNNSSSNSCSI